VAAFFVGDVDLDDFVLLVGCRCSPTPFTSSNRSMKPVKYMGKRGVGMEKENYFMSAGQRGTCIGKIGAHECWTEGHSLPIGLEAK
jgi:hypothetical protein